MRAAGRTSCRAEYHEWAPTTPRYAPTFVLRRLDLRGAGLDLRDRLPRPSQSGDAPLAAVQEIIAGVRARGDAALREYTERFDGVALDDVRVAPADVTAALARAP